MPLHGNCGRPGSVETSIPPGRQRRRREVMGIPATAPAGCKKPDPDRDPFSRDNPSHQNYLIFILSATNGTRLQTAHSSHYRMGELPISRRAGKRTLVMQRPPRISGVVCWNMPPNPPISTTSMSVMPVYRYPVPPELHTAALAAHASSARAGYSPGRANRSGHQPSDWMISGQRPPSMLAGAQFGAGAACR